MPEQKQTAGKRANQKESMIAITMKRMKKNRGAMIGLVIVILLALVAIFAEQIAPYPYEKQDLMNTFALPSSEHLCGTDELGRDILSRLIYGSRYSLRIGLIAVAISASIGVTLGAISGFYGGKVDMVIMRVLDVFQAIPGLLMAVAVSATLGPGLTNCIIALSISNTPSYARMCRAAILNVRSMEYVEAARSTNATDFLIIIKHILPNALSPTLVQATMGVASAIISAAALSFIGLGVQPPMPEWGAMLSAGRNYIRDAWHLAVFPGLTIMVTVLSLNMLGDGLRDALDPRLKS